MNKTNGFGPLPCIKCGEQSAITLDLSDLGTLHCEECDNTYMLAEVRAALDKWDRVIDWIDKVGK